MKRKLKSLLLLVGVGLILMSCGTASKPGAGSGQVTLKVGASPTPHAEILEHIQPALAAEGVNLEIMTFEDFVLPNKALAGKDIDANYFQHVPFFERAIAENGYDFVNKGLIHIELMGLYSRRITDIQDLAEGAKVVVSNSEADWGRVLTILQTAGLVKIKAGTDLATAKFDDIAENPKHLEFIHDVNPELLVTIYSNDEADLVAMNANFANRIGLSPTTDSLLVEQDNSPYGNLLAVRADNQDDPAIEKLLAALRSAETQAWITEKWGGVIKPIGAE